MKVKELVEALSGLDQEMEIILSGDSEGNNFSPLDDWSIAIYKQENDWSGYIYDLTWSAEDASLDEQEWDKMLDMEPRSIILWPIN